jgi:hypothetical protein
VYLFNARRPHLKPYLAIEEEDSELRHGCRSAQVWHDILFRKQSEQDQTTDWKTESLRRSSKRPQQLPLQRLLECTKVNTKANRIQIGLLSNTSSLLHG